MRALRIAAVVALLAFGVTLALPGPNATAAGGKKTVRVHLMAVKVSETNAKGEAWDINKGKPDIQVKIKNLSDNSLKEFVSKEKSDTFEATYNVPTVLAMEGQTLQIQVLDKDLVQHDEIGTMKVQVTRELIDKGKTELKFQQVKSLTLEFKAP